MTSRNVVHGTAFSSQIRTKLRDWAVWLARASCNSWTAMSSNYTKTLLHSATAGPGNSTCMWFDEVNSWCCLPILPQLECNILANTYEYYFRAQCSTSTWVIKTCRGRYLNNVFIGGGDILQTHGTDRLCKMRTEGEGRSKIPNMLRTSFKNGP